MRLWLIPLSGLIAGLVLAIGALAIDRASGYDLVSQTLTGDAAAASNLLATIITAVVTLLSVVLTVMTVAIQLAMGQFSPRIVAALLRDRLHQFSFALFGATVAFAIVGVLGIDERRQQVPGLTVFSSYVLAIASLGVLVVYVSHAGERLRASGLIDIVGVQLHHEIDRLFPADGRSPPVEPGAIPSERSGVVIAIDTERLVRLATGAGCVLELEPRMGDFVARGGTLVRPRGCSPERVEQARKMIALGGERTHDLDTAYGIRKLVDIAIRSASEDPTTTVEALHRIHDAMRELAWRPFPTGRLTDAAGRLRVIIPVRDWGDYVRLAFEEIRLAGAGQPQIERRLRAALEDLRGLVEPERRPALDEQLELLDKAVERAHATDRDARVARRPDLQGLG